MNSKQIMARSDAWGVEVDKMSWTVASPISSAGWTSVRGRFLPGGSASLLMDFGGSARMYHI